MGLRCRACDTRKRSGPAEDLDPALPSDSMKAKACPAPAAALPLHTPRPAPMHNEIRYDPCSPAPLTGLGTSFCFFLPELRGLLWGPLSLFFDTDPPGPSTLVRMSGARPVIVRADPWDLPRAVLRTGMGAAFLGLTAQTDFCVNVSAMCSVCFAWTNFAIKRIFFFVLQSATLRRDRPRVAPAVAVSQLPNAEGRQATEPMGLGFPVEEEGRPLVHDASVTRAGAE